MCDSEPHEGVLSAAARGHVRRESEGRSGSGSGDGDQQRQPQRQQVGYSLPALALPSSFCYATRVRPTVIARARVRVCVVCSRHLNLSFYAVLVSPQTQRVHRVRVAHSSAVLAAAGVSYPHCFASGLLVLYAHSAGRRLSYRRPSDCHPDRIPRAVQGMVTEPFCSEEIRSRESDDAPLCVSADVGAAHVFAVPRLHVCPAVDHLLRTGRSRPDQSEPEPERVLLRRHPHGSGVLEPRNSQHPPAHGPQQSGKPAIQSDSVSISVYHFAAFL